MYRAKPTLNKLLSKKWEEIEQKLHENKLKMVKSCLDSKTPLRFKHIRQNYKKGQQTEDRYTEIERENRILMEKMTLIYSKPSKIKKISRAAKKELVSSHYNNRQTQKLKINYENQHILRRLQQRTSNYSVKEWKKDNKQRRKILKNICEFPYQMHNPRFHNNRSVSPHLRLPNHRLNSTKRSRMDFSTRSNQRCGSKLTSTLQINSRDDQMHIPHLRERTAPRRRRRKIKLLYRQEVCMKSSDDKGSLYNIEILKNKKNKHMYLMARNESSADNRAKDDYYIELSRKQASKVKKIFDNSYSSMVDSIRIHDNKLVLLNLNSSQPSNLPPPTSVPPLPNQTSESRNQAQDPLRDPSEPDPKINNTIS
ncbi:unnamed protein product [Moneuplotes crassus]|uniref:Uncharacterized protein n=1 Tax=Euplotes crassus TaxID=5936 RepID=A0AAD1XEA9_EUPCR|nr:unnamed protein product [Moneuplotes crassus]